jgi:predicted AlkP superfamily pyrophosphatase or phosphodiesterase
MRIAALIAGFVAGLLPAIALAAPVLLISIDGLRPGDLLDAQARGIKVPALRALMAEGVYATGVKNVLPTVTYPNHTTLITGVSPARHHISSNTVFDPLGASDGGWYWYASDIAAPTLWDAVHATGRTVANIAWPVSVGASSIDANIPEYWGTSSPDNMKLLRALATPGLAADLESRTTTSFTAMFADTVEADEAKADYAAAMIQAKRPALMTLHLVSLDDAQHGFGPGAPEAHEALARIDIAVGRLVTAARRVQPDTVVAIVSDHGFAPVAKNVNLKSLFADEGLLTLDTGKTGVTAWEASPWGAGGTAAVVLARPDDAVLRAKVAALLAGLARRPDLGIAQVIDEKEIAARGGAREAAFFVNFKAGFEMGDALTGPAVTPSGAKGMHGYFPDMPEMRAALVISGPGLPRKGSLGEVDMRDIAPTLARIVKVALPGAEGKPLF